MRALILAAGEGTRLKRYTEGLPKGMLEFQGRTLIRRQIDAFHACGLRDVGIVRGFCASRIDYEDAVYFENPDWASTNMVQSLLRARAWFDQDLIVAYADICFHRRVLDAVRLAAAPVAVAVDVDWRDYWKRRYGRLDFDTESLRIGAADRIESLGVSDPPLDEISGRYVGLLKFSARSLAGLAAVCDEAKISHWDRPWQQSGKPFRQAYMTDLLQELIDRGEDVRAVTVRGGWLEFDTNEDYETQRHWAFDEGESEALPA